MKSTFRPTLAALILLAAAGASAQVCNLSEIDTIAAPGSLGQSVIFNNSAYVAGGTGGIVEINITDPAALDVKSFSSTPGEARGLVLEFLRDQLVVADGPAGIGVYNVAGDGTVAEENTTDLGENIISITGDSGRFYAGSEQGTLFAVSVASGAAPAVMSSVDLGGQVVGTAKRSSAIFCALGTANALAVVDASDFANLTLLESIPMSGAVTAVTRSGSTLLVAVEGSGLHSFTIDGDQLTAGESLPLANTATSLFEWDQRVYAAGPDLGIVVADASLGEGFLQLAEHALDDSLDLALSGDTLYVSRGLSGYTSLDTSACDNAGDSQTTWFIPAAARATGAENTFWVTDVAITNFTSGVGTFNLAYLPQGLDNSAPLSTSMAIGPGQQMLLTDVFDSVFGAESGNGALRIVTSDIDVKITSRTYNAAGAEGTYGQFIPALTNLSAMSPGVTGVILQLQQNDAFRTNLGMVNITDHEVQAQVRLYNGDGTLLGILAEPDTLLLPFESRQIGRAFTRVTSDPVDNGYALVTVTSENAKALFYASVVDNGSGDPIYVPTQALEANFSN